MLQNKLFLCRTEYVQAPGGMGSPTLNCSKKIRASMRPLFCRECFEIHFQILNSKSWDSRTLQIKLSETIKEKG